MRNLQYYIQSKCWWSFFFVGDRNTLRSNKFNNFSLHLMTFLKTRSASREKPVPGGRILNSSSKTFSKTPFRRIPSPGHRSISTFGFSRLDQAWTQSHWQCQFDTDKPHRGLYILVTVTVKCRIIRPTLKSLVFEIGDQSVSKSVTSSISGCFIKLRFTVWFTGHATRSDILVRLCLFVFLILQKRSSRLKWVEL